MKKFFQIAVSCILLLGLVSCDGASDAGVKPESGIVPFESGYKIDLEAREKIDSYVDKAIDQMQYDWDKTRKKLKEPYISSSYRRILQTTIFLLDEKQPDGASNTEKEIWSKYYSDVVCIVKFVTLEDYYGCGEKGYFESMGVNNCYAIKKDGSVNEISFREIFAVMAYNPIVLGVHPIEAGNNYNQTVGSLDD